MAGWKRVVHSWIGDRDARWVGAIQPHQVALAGFRNSQQPGREPDMAADGPLDVQPLANVWARGKKRCPTSELVWSTAVVTPARAREAGIVSEVFPAAELDAAVNALCEQIMKAPRPARVRLQRLPRVALDMDVTGAIEYARSIHAVINSSSEMLPKGHK